MIANPSFLVFLGSCPDRVGLIAAVSGFFAMARVNIVKLEQHVERGRFFIRVEGQSLELHQSLADWNAAFAGLGRTLDMTWQFFDPQVSCRVALLASKTLSCPMEVLTGQYDGSLPVSVSCLISNHSDLAEVASRFRLPFYHIPALTGSRDHEAEQLRVLANHEVDVVVLARYMRILSGDFLRELNKPVINIHHSFLPSFAGSDPYGQAFARGVKLIGATAHFVTEKLDEGPIIAQDIHPVHHGYSVEEMKRSGAHIEKSVLAGALRKFAEHKIIEWNGRTVVFH
ncbi:MAG: formyltetrahydrofolate deformylase [Magnetococcales bacterium]|nr:formyltetrahydrofolate deformylase [Magnetococcales bacterium]